MQALSCAGVGNEAGADDADAPERQGRKGQRWDQNIRRDLKNQADQQAGDKFPFAKKQQEPG